MLIHKLELGQDSMILSLAKDEDDDDDDDDNTTTHFMNIQISLKETAHANASALFAKYRASKEKSQKAVEACTPKPCMQAAADENAQRQFLEAPKCARTITRTR